MRRMLWSLLVLFGLSVVIFTIARAMPGDPVRLALGPRASAEQVEQLRQSLGMDKPLVQQYGLYVTGLAEGDFGLSLLTKRPVSDDIRETFAATFELVLATITIAFVLGVPLGIVAARWKDQWPDNLVRLIAIFSAVTPSFFLALVLQILAGYILHVLPTTGRLPPGLTFSADITGLMTIDSLLHGRLDVFGQSLRYLLLPSLALSAATMGQIARITRASMIDVASQDYIEASRAFGIPERVRVLKYMLRPSFVPPLTISGLEFASLIGNAFVVELVFAWPGMAAYGVRTIMQKDLNAVMGVVIVSGVFFVVVNLIIDVLVGVVDPRIRIRGRR
ncbi:peptide/nickel transport system permease protein [Rhizobium sp. BK313]|uniref:ABC transporter permease n=1 Tax=Rhizobium sp. BK313 TaxID=2587081 RepID=UPI0018033106|nr:ABC transporter permease [Rhizobium sp. BK313]MBB3459014.1 peptide/nickel transport system permease protein [Rhizobium sp. BK313]